MVYYDNRNNETFECYVVNFNHEQILLYIAELKLMLNFSFLGVLLLEISLLLRNFL